MNFKLKTQSIASFHQVNGSAAAAPVAADGGDYVFDIDCALDSSCILASLSDRNVHIYDPNTLAMRGKVSVHDDKINCLEASKYHSEVFCTGSDDKFVKLWDTRVLNNGSISSYKMDDEVSGASIGMGGWLLAVGSQTSLTFFDLRMHSGNTHKRKLGEYADIHTDIITQVKFHPLQPSMLTSAAEDGLVCIFDTSVQEEEEAVVSILNTECPVRRFGFFGDNYEGLYSLSTIETASIWHFPSAQRITDFTSIRTDNDVDYLVDCLYDPTSDNLVCVGGKYDGNATVINIEPNKSTTIGSLSSGGHAATIRCCLYQHGTLFTGGEDSRICSWEPSSAPVTSSMNHNSNSSSHRHSSGAMKHHKRKDQLRAKPY